MKILLVEDELNFGAVLRDYLGMNGFETDWVTDGEAGYAAFIKGEFDLCILDVMMPKKDGFELARDIRKRKPEQALMFLTARSMKVDVLDGFKIGADDYVTKPFDSEELLYRIKAILRRSGGQVEEDTETEFQIGIFHFDYTYRKLSHGENSARLSPKEAELLRLLVLNKNELLTRQKALTSLWGDDNYFNARSMDVFVSKLRKHFKPDPNIQIENIHSKGFRLLVRA